MKLNLIQHPTVFIRSFASNILFIQPKKWKNIKNRSIRGEECSFVPFPKVPMHAMLACWSCSCHECAWLIQCVLFSQESGCCLVARWLDAVTVRKSRRRQLTVRLLSEPRLRATTAPQYAGQLRRATTGLRCTRLRRSTRAHWPTAWRARTSWGAATRGAQLSCFKLQVSTTQMVLGASKEWSVANWPTAPWLSHHQLIRVASKVSVMWTADYHHWSDHQRPDDESLWWYSAKTGLFSCNLLWCSSQSCPVWSDQRQGCQFEAQWTWCHLTLPWQLVSESVLRLNSGVVPVISRGCPTHTSTSANWWPGNWIEARWLLH